MLNVTFNDGKTQNFWVSNTLHHVKVNINNVILMQADGDELAHILNEVKNIPYSLPVTYWYGELARTILLNTNWE